MDGLSQVISFGGELRKWMRMRSSTRSLNQRDKREVTKELETGKRASRQMVRFGRQR